MFGYLFACLRPLRLGPQHPGGELVAAHLVKQLDLRPFVQRARNAAAQAAVGQQPEGVFAERRVAAVAFAVADVVHTQAVGQVPGADDVDAVGEHQNADGGAGEVVAVHQGVDQQFLQGNFRHFQHARRVEALVALHPVQVTFDEGQRFGVLLGQGAADVLAVQVAGVGDAGARKGHGLDGERGPPAQRVAAK